MIDLLVMTLVIASAWLTYRIFDRVTGFTGRDRW